MKVHVLDKDKKYSERILAFLREKNVGIDEVGNFDVLLALLYKDDTEMGFKIAEASTRGKYVLVLAPAGFEPKGIREKSKFLTLKYFTGENLLEIVSAYVAKRERGNLRRFNFVIDGEIANYLNHIQRDYGKSKSDFVRELIKKEMKNKHIEIGKFQQAKK
ncbi:MAG: hypothetical protein ACD_63C00091G0014 [uncultured bacterium]|nr:MAG: hypothetical protein ACD_63C00091G0014 [uncultured bacterium]